MDVTICRSPEALFSEAFWVFNGELPLTRLVAPYPSLQAALSSGAVGFFASLSIGSSAASCRCFITSARNHPWTRRVAAWISSSCCARQTLHPGSSFAPVLPDNRPGAPPVQDTRKYTRTPTLLLWYFPDLRKVPDGESPGNNRVGSSGTPAPPPRRVATPRRRHLALDPAHVGVVERRTAARLRVELFG